MTRKAAPKPRTRAKRAAAPTPPDLPRFSHTKPSPVLTDDVVARLRAIPQTPSKLSLGRHLPFAITALADFLVQAPPWLAKARGRLHPYPLPFKRVTIPSWDGTPLTGWLGVHGTHRKDGTVEPEPRQAILVVPGLFSTKDNLTHRARAMRFFRDWGYHVLSLDLRGFGESERVYSTGGWKESHDVEAALEFFRSHAPVEKLHIYAESMGAAATIVACANHAKKGFRLVDGGILAISPFADLKTTVQHITQRPKPGQWDAIVYIHWFYQRLLDLGGMRYDSLREYLKDAAKHYGLTLNGLYKRVRPADVIGDVNVPMLLVVSEDDPLVTKDQITAFEKALRGRANPTLLRMAWGSHAMFELLDARWFWNLIHEFFDFYCVLPPAAAGKR